MNQVTSTIYPKPLASLIVLRLLVALICALLRLRFYRYLFYFFLLIFRLSHGNFDFVGQVY